MVIESVQRQLDDCEMLLNREVQVLSSHRKPLWWNWYTLQT